MKNPLKIAIILLVLVNVKQSYAVGPHPEQEAEWCYWERPECNPDTWGGTCKTGLRQSPIPLNIYSVSSIGRIHVKPGDSRLSHFYSEQELNVESFGIQNTGHGFQITFRATTPPIVIDPFYPNNGKSFIFSQAHFHWGLGNGKNGSEHIINDKTFDGELHLVHYSTQYDSLESALKADTDPESVLVIGILLEGVKEPNNPYLEPILKAIPSISKYDPLLKIRSVYESINLEKLFPNNLNYFRYFGSLTSPQCDQQVLWLVQEHPIPISYSQLEIFRQIEDVRGLKLQENFRRLQKRNERKVYYYNVFGNKKHSFQPY